MTGKHLKKVILREAVDHDPTITVGALALTVGASTRSIRTYIAELISDGSLRAEYTGPEHSPRRLYVNREEAIL